MPQFVVSSRSEEGALGTHTLASPRQWSWKKQQAEFPDSATIAEAALDVPDDAIQSDVPLVVERHTLLVPGGVVRADRAGTGETKKCIVLPTLCDSIQTNPTIRQV